MECSKITDWKYEMTWTTNNGLVILGNAWLAPHGPLLLSLAQRSSVSSPLVSSSNQLTFSPSLLFLTQPIQSAFYNEACFLYCPPLFCGSCIFEPTGTIFLFKIKTSVLHERYYTNVKYWWNILANYFLMIASLHSLGMILPMTFSILKTMQICFRVYLAASETSSRESPGQEGTGEKSILESCRSAISLKIKEMCM